MSQDAPGALEQLAVTLACQQLIARYAHLNDERDAEALALLFTEDGVFARPSAPDQPVSGRTRIREHFAARPPEPLTRHLFVNVMIDVIGASEARATSYVVLYTAPAREPFPRPAQRRQMIGGFRDHIVREADGVWRFRERRGELALTFEG